MSMEFNKLLAAILVAGIVAMLAGFVAKKLVHPHLLAENAFHVEVAEAASAGGDAVAAPAMAEPVTELMAAADAARGEKLAKVCAACHTFDQGGPNRIGPNLSGVFGGPKAHAPDFAYSDAMKNKGGTWTEDDLNTFLWNPKKFVPGTKMTFVGIKKPEDRAALIKWLETQ
jgi:cytochrome c